MLTNEPYCKVLPQMYPAGVTIGYLLKYRAQFIRITFMMFFLILFKFWLYRGESSIMIS